MWDAIDRLDWVFEGARSWSVSLEAAHRGFAGTRVARFNEEGPRWFRILGEAIGPQRRDFFGDPAAEAELSIAGKSAIAELRALGVRNASPIDTLPGGRPYIVVGTVGPGGWTDGRSVNEAIEQASFSNVEKLTNAEAEERDLWLWVDQTDNESYVAMCTFSLPREGPALPDGIDTAWAAVWMPSINPQSNIYVLWRVRRGDPWERVVVPEVRRYASAVTVQSPQPLAHAP